MKLLTQFARGELSLAKTFWGGYIGISLLNAIIISTLVTFTSIKFGNVLFFLAFAWALFASWAVIKSAAKNGNRSVWGWIATIYVILASGWAIFSFGRIYVLHQL